MKKLVCFLLFVLMYGRTSAQASDITIFGGLQRQGKITLQNATSSAPSLLTFDSKNFGTVGLRFGIGKHIFGGESTFAYNPNFISSNIKAVVLSQNLMIQAPLPILKPYFTAGLGTFITAGKGSTINTVKDIGTKFAVNYGGGVKAFVAGPVGVRFDARGYTLPSVQNQSLNVFEVSLGLVFSF